MGDERDIDALLIEAAKEGNLGAVEFLVKKGADVNARNIEGKTALMYAVGNTLGVVRLLLEHGADINAKNNHGETALVLARAYKNYKISGFLKKHGAKE